jgi:hypothetical protein
MRQLRSPWTRAFIVWTVTLLVAAVLLAAIAVNGLLRAADACYFQIGPCAEVGDPANVQLAFAFFGIPLIWVVGVLVGAACRAVAGRRRTAAR